VYLVEFGVVLCCDLFEFIFGLHCFYTTALSCSRKVCLSLFNGFNCFVDFIESTNSFDEFFVGSLGIRYECRVSAYLRSGEKKLNSYVVLKQKVLNQSHSFVEIFINCSERLPQLHNSLSFSYTAISNV
jgi:hypothetical protein